MLLHVCIHCPAPHSQHRLQASDLSCLWQMPVRLNYRKKEGPCSWCRLCHWQPAGCLSGVDDPGGEGRSGSRMGKREELGCHGVSANLTNFTGAHWSCRATKGQGRGGQRSWAGGGTLFSQDVPRSLTAEAVLAELPTPSGKRPSALWGARGTASL